MTPERAGTFAADSTTLRPASVVRRATKHRPVGHRRSRTPRGHWLLVILVMLVFALGLLIEGYTHGILGENSADEPAQGPHVATAPATLINGGPIIQVAGSNVRSYSLPARTVALTFDDGPDPTWTPAVLAVLRRFHVPATFFLVGAHAASYPDLVRAELADGDEVGSHTYSHANLAAAAGWREGFELALTQNALAGAAGVRTRLLRMPYSSEPDALSAADWRAARQAGLDGYMIVLTNLDTKDWTRPGVKRIVAAAMPSGGKGAVIMLHDGGGNRAQTVAALARIITRLRSEGYRFTTITNGLSQPPGDVPATSRQRFAGTRACGHATGRRPHGRHPGGVSRDRERADLYPAVRARCLRARPSPSDSAASEAIPRG
jgi:peptidoglycan/xylan/chitin deacetylase (PgdA/CDA1 family)